LLVLAVVAAVLLTVLYVVAVRTAWGQDLDDAALDGRATRPIVLHATGRLLDTISVTSLVLLGGAAVAIAAARRRLHLALVAATVVTGAIATSELLKLVVLGRPELGTTDPLPTPSFPSGHATVAMSLGVAFVLVVPARVRAVTAVCAVGYACLIGTGTVTAGWHRPSDVMAGFLVVAIWAAIATAGLIRWRGATAERESEHFGEPVVSPTLAWSGAVLLALGFAGFVIVYLAIRQDRLDAVRLDGAYAASLVAIVGVAFVLVAAFLAALRGVGLDAPPSEPVRSAGARRGTAPRAR
jgi:membrane-associated phospholipid phosphatase